MPRRGSYSYEFIEALEITPPSKAEVDLLLNRVDRMLDFVRDADVRKRIADEVGERIVAPAAVRRAPISEKSHYRYVNVKKGQRRKRGTALNDRIKYFPGNLKLSIRLLKFLKRAQSANIGPRKLDGRAKAKSYGRNRNNVDAYYAQMVFKGYEEFRKRVMEPALLQQEGKAYAYIEREINKLVRRGLQKNGFTGFE